MKLLNRPTRTDEPTITLESIGPDQASAMLECNRRNRRVSQTSVNQFANDMVAGNWHMTGESIKFDVDGDLLDGQHRLWAVIQSGVTVPFIVVRGLRPDAQDVMDTGRKRSSADMLLLNGYSNTNVIAGAVRLVINYQRGNLKKAAQTKLEAVTHSEVLAFVHSNPTIAEAARWAKASRRALPMTPSVVAACLFILQGIDEDQANEFFTDLAEFRTNGKGDPRHTLLMRFKSLKDAKTSAPEQMHFIFRTWNAVRHGESLGVLKSGQTDRATSVTTSFDFVNPA